jgi:hypothetical protein
VGPVGSVARTGEQCGQRVATHQLSRFVTLRAPRSPRPSREHLSHVVCGPIRTRHDGGVVKGAVQRGGDAMARGVGSVLPDSHCMDCRRWSALIRLAIARMASLSCSACCVHILCSLHNEYLSPTLLCCRMFGRSPQQGGLVWRSQGLLCPFICMFSCACVVHGQCRCTPPLAVDLARSSCLVFFLSEISHAL